jgi:hypothetical protein
MSRMKTRSPLDWLFSISRSFTFVIMYTQVKIAYLLILGWDESSCDAWVLSCTTRLMIKSGKVYPYYKRMTSPPRLHQSPENRLSRRARPYSGHSTTRPLLLSPWRADVLEVCSDKTFPSYVLSQFSYDFFRVYTQRKLEGVLPHVKLGTTRGTPAIKPAPLAASLSMKPDSPTPLPVIKDKKKGHIWRHPPTMTV